MRILITGGGGFLGGSIARRLLARGDAVVCLQHSEALELKKAGAEIRRGDLADTGVVAAAALGCEAVIHTAAKAGVWGPYDSYHRPNVVGTEQVIAACRPHDIRYLVHTSTPSVVYDGSDEDGIDESAPYCARPMNAYQATKILAEQLVLAADGAQLHTVALRPHLIWGPGDPHLVPRILTRARKGRLRLIGGAPKRVDATYIDNAAAAHVAALDRLVADGSAADCRGRAYFIGNDEPMPLNDLILRIMQAAGLQQPPPRIGPRRAYALGVICEGIYRLMRRRSEPPLTRFVARQLSTAHWFRLDAARRDLGYEPLVDTDTGMRHLAASLAESAAP
ncbi:MAG: NAD-dependent epimerase/dehydratase family protein [Planctomycetota bacterium]